MISLWGEDLPVGTLENLYLTVAAETGLLSLLILCAVFWGAIRRAFQAIPKAHSSLLATVESGVGVALIAAMACGLTDPVLTSTQNGLLLFLLLGVQRSIHRNNCVSPGTLSSSQVRESA
jgi:O-antigen ligase